MSNALPTFFTFWPWGLTFGSKFTKIRDDLLPTQIYHRAKSHPTPEITVIKNCRQTVNDIWPPCLSACGDNKQVPKISENQNQQRLTRQLIDNCINIILPSCISVILFYWKWPSGWNAAKLQMQQQNTTYYGGSNSQSSRWIDTLVPYGCWIL